VGEGETGGIGGVRNEHRRGRWGRSGDTRSVPRRGRGAPEIPSRGSQDAVFLPVRSVPERTGERLGRIGTDPVLPVRTGGASSSARVPPSNRSAVERPTKGEGSSPHEPGKRARPAHEGGPHSGTVKRGCLCNHSTVLRCPTWCRARQPRRKRVRRGFRLPRASVRPST